MCAPLGQKKGRTCQVLHWGLYLIFFSLRKCLKLLQIVSHVFWIRYLKFKLVTQSPVCKNWLILPPVCPWLWISAPEILKGQLWRVPLQLFLFLIYQQLFIHVEIQWIPFILEYIQSLWNYIIFIFTGGNAVRQRRSYVKQSQVLPGREILCEELPLLHSNATKEIPSSLAVVRKILVKEETFPWRSFCSFHEMWPRTSNNEWVGSHDTPTFEQIILGLNWGGDLDYQGPESRVLQLPAPIQSK